MKGKFALAIHGGAGTIAKENMTGEQQQEHKEALFRALYAGLRILQGGGNSLDAVQASVVNLEDCALFNAGKGSVFNSDGIHEMDAAIMEGTTLRAGAAAAIQNIKNPIKLARAILDGDKYVLLSGDKATRLASANGLPLAPDDYFYTSYRFDEWQAAKNGGSDRPGFGTVGAVALDSDGHLAAATSTGGLVNKEYGPIGDSCIIGGGTYADDRTCAVSCTGDGEAFIRAVAAYDIACLLAYRNMPLKEACDLVLKNKVARLGGSGGLIAIDRAGQIEMPFSSEGMYRACCYLNGTIECGIF